MKRSSFFISITGFILCSCGQEQKKVQLPFYNSPDFTPQWIAPNEKGYSTVHTIAPFSFTNQNGKTISNKNLAGKIYVANFFFTSCGSICPKMMNNLKKVQNAFSKDNQVFILSHSVTPEVDNVSRLRNYQQRMNINGKTWWLLTGSIEAVYKIARRSYFADEETGYNKDSREFLHTENCILVDGKGRIRGVYNATLELEMNKLIEHVKILKRGNCD